MQDTQKIKTTTYRKISKREQWLALGIFILLVISLFYNLGLAPLKHEEPRRALIALEMLFRDNWIVPTEFGEYYYKKPPLYNWLIIAGFKLFGSYSELAVRFFSILSFIGSGVLVFWMGQKFVNRTYGILAGLLTLCMVDILYYFSTTAGEIDLFFSFVTLSSFFTIYYFHQKQEYLWLFVITYILGAIGTLTKGLPSVVFLGVSLGAFFLYKGEFKKLFSLHHVIGIFVYLFMVGGYFYIYSLHNSLEGFYASDESLWSQASERTVLENGFVKFVKHFVSFPLVTLKNIAPASLLLIFFFRKNILQIIRAQPFISFCLLILGANILVYWISPGTRSRYLYMLYPLAVMVLTYGYVHGPPVQSKKQQFLKWTVIVLILLALLASVAMPFVPLLSQLDHILLTSILAVLALGTLLYFAFRRPFNSVLQLILLAVIIRFIFGATVLPLRSSQSSEATDKEDAKRIVALAQGVPLYMYERENVSRTTVFYIERARQEVLPFKSEAEKGAFFLAKKSSLVGKNYQLYHTFTYANQEFGLIKFTHFESNQDPQGG